MYIYISQHKHNCFFFIYLFYFYSRISIFSKNINIFYNYLPVKMSRYNKFNNIQAPKYQNDIFNDIYRE